MKSVIKIVQIFVVVLLGISLIPSGKSLAAQNFAQKEDQNTQPVEIWSQVVPGGGYQAQIHSSDLRPSHTTNTTCNPTAITFTAPANKSTVDTLTPRFQWSSVSGVTDYIFQISKTTDFSTKIYDGYWYVTSSQMTHLLYFNFEANTTYYWRIAGYCSDTRVTGPFTTWSFKVGNVPSSFIDPPAIFGPADGARFPDGNVTISWANVDGATGVQFTFSKSYEDAKKGYFISKRWGEYWTTSTKDNFDYLVPGTLYWTMQVKNKNGWGKPSPILSFTLGNYPVDLRFRPNPNGYNFKNPPENTLDQYPLAPGISIDDVIRMFDRQTVCVGNLPVCIPKASVAAWRLKVNLALNGGHCMGMSSTAVNYYKDPTQLSQVKPGVTAAYQVDKGSAIHNINYDQALQYTQPLKTDVNNAWNSNPNNVLNTLQQNFTSGAADPYILVIRSADKKYGHAVLPYAVKSVNSSETDVFIYDSNYPNEAARFIKFDPSANNWSYDLGSGYGVWSGANNIAIIPLSKIKQKPTGMVNPQATSQNMLSSALTDGTEIWSDGAQNLWVSNSSGQRLGYVNGTLVNEIPGALVTPHFGDLDTLSNPVLDLPTTDVYTIHLDGTSAGPVSNASVTQFSNGFVAEANHIGLSSTSQDVFTVAADGSRVSYSASEQKPVGMSLGVDLADRTANVEVGGLVLGNGQTAKLLSSPQNTTFGLDASQASTGTYDLELKINTGDQYLWFVHHLTEVQANDTQIIDYGSYTGNDLTISIDHGSDGSIDETMTLENQLQHIYLPNLMR